MEQESRYLNVDLEVWSRMNLEPLVQAFGAVNLHHGLISGRWHASFEVEPEADAETALAALIQRVRGLDPVARSRWDAAERRESNIGIQAGEGPEAFELPLSSETLAALAQLGGRLVITVYGSGGRQQ
jgi:hypothetical protein